MEIEQAQYAWLWWLLLLPIGPIIGGIVAALSDRDAKKIAILGLPASGKTTLFQKLGASSANDSQVNTSIRDIEEFTFQRSNGEKVTIAKTKDLGGQNEYVKLYENVIEENTFIYFLLKMEDLYLNNSLSIGKTKMLPIKSRMTKIKKIITDKGIKKHNMGFIITHFDEYLKNNPAASEKVIESDIRYAFSLDKKSIVLIGNLLDNDFITQIKDRIGMQNEQ